MKRSLVSLLLVSVLSGSSPLVALADTPAASGPVSASLVLTDGFGMRSPALEEKWQQKFVTSLSSGNIVFTSGQTLVSGPAAAGLSETQRQSLMSAPDLLTASSYVGQFVPNRWLLVLNVGDGDNPAIHPTMMDLQKHESHPLADAYGKTTEETMTQLTDGVRSFLTQTSQTLDRPVKGNVLSKLYHLSSADHIQAEDCVTFISEADAKNHGYQPCTICYPHATGIVKNDPTEVALGREVSASVEQEYRISKDEKAKERIDRIGTRLVEASDIRDFPFTFTLLESDEINAFSAGAGSVFITTGIVNVLESDDQLATVLGHEMAHCENHHIIRTYRSAQTMSILGVIVGAATGSLGHVMTNFMSMIFGRGYSRNFELQADHGGLLYTYAAGYNPDAFIITLKKLKDVSALQKSHPPQWLRTHPTEDKRIEAINEELGHIKTYDARVQDVRRRDPGLADEMQKHAAFYVDHADVLTAFSGAYDTLKIALDPTIATSANTTAMPAPSLQKHDNDTRD